MTISLKSYHQKDKPLTTKQIKLRDFVMGLLLYLISKQNWLQQSISYKHMLMAKLLSKQHHESNLAFLCTTHFKTEFFIKPEMTAASTKLRLTWAAMKVKSNPSPARAGNSCPWPCNTRETQHHEGHFPSRLNGMKCFKRAVQIRLIPQSQEAGFSSRIYYCLCLCSLESRLLDPGG